MGMGIGRGGCQMLLLGLGKGKGRARVRMPLALSLGEFGPGRRLGRRLPLVGRVGVGRGWLRGGVVRGVFWFCRSDDMEGVVSGFDEIYTT